MTNRCPHLDYRSTAGDREFETPRAYCTVVDRFVQPMRADVCNARHDLAPDRHCEFYRDHEGIEDPWLVDGEGDSDRPDGEPADGRDGDGEVETDGDGTVGSDGGREASTGGDGEVETDGGGQAGTNGGRETGALEDRPVKDGHEAGDR